VQILVRTVDGTAPSVDEPLGVGDWEKVHSLADVENLYDLGFWDNLVDVFVPDYSFRDQAGPDVERGRKSRKNRGKPKKVPAAKAVDALT
jgi:palmitoyltransferase ZDHHC4